MKKNGEWQIVAVSHGWNGKVYPETYRCSICAYCTDEATPHCPKCGAEMRSEWHEKAGKYLWE